MGRYFSSNLSEKNHVWLSWLSKTFSTRKFRLHFITRQLMKSNSGCVCDPCKFECSFYSSQQIDINSLIGRELSLELIFESVVSQCFNVSSSALFPSRFASKLCIVIFCTFQAVHFVVALRRRSVEIWLRRVVCFAEWIILYVSRRTIEHKPFCSSYASRLYVTRQRSKPYFNCCCCCFTSLGKCVQLRIYLRALAVHADGRLRSRCNAWE